jgi:hypothetical protein
MPYGFYDEDAKVAALPHPQIALRVFLVVEAAIRATWVLMRDNPRPNTQFDLKTGVEDAITHELYERLFDEVFNKGVVDGFDPQLLTVLTRESKVRNHDGEHLDKMPDLLVGLIRHCVISLPSQDWLFIECKPIDTDHSTGIHYCDKGIIRFVRGDYAWAMTSALMVGYARAGYEILTKLPSALEKRPTMATKSPPTECWRSKPTSYAEATCISEHERNFTYENGRNAPPIVLRHLWLLRD